MPSGIARASGCLVAVLCWGWLGSTAATAQNWSLPQLMSELAQTRTADARFVERKYLKILTAPLESTGTLHYRAPQRLEKRTLTPKRELLLVEGNQLTLENARGHQRRYRLQDNALLWAFVESLRATLAGDQATLERFYRVRLQGDRPDWQLALTPKQEKMSVIISEIRIAGAAGRLETIEIREAQGDRSVMTVLGAAQ